MLRPYRDEFRLRRGRDMFENFFDNVLTEPKWLAEKDEFSVDVVEKDNLYEVKAELPGYKKEDIKITTEDKYLKICAEREERKEEKGENYLRKEISHGKIQRSFYIPDMDEEGIKAKYSDGMLCVTVNKKLVADKKPKIVIE